MNSSEWNILTVGHVCEEAHGIIGSAGVNSAEPAPLQRLSEGARELTAWHGSNKGWKVNVRVEE
jgi:hypothetical protein